MSKGNDDGDEKKKDADSEDDGEALIDSEMRRVATEIHRLREQFAFERIDNTKNSKFTIAAQENNAEQRGDAKGLFSRKH